MCVWNKNEVAALVGSASLMKTTLTGMCYEVPAFAGTDSYRLTTLLGEMGRFQPLLESVSLLLIPEIYKDKK